MDPKVALLGALAVFTLYFIVMLWTAIARKRAAGVDVAPTPALLVTGFVTNFFDTLGIGSMATTTAIVRQFKLLRDELNPGTQNVGHALPVIAQAFIYTRLVPVNATTLVTMIAAAVAGSYFGAGIVCRWSRRAIQVGMGSALLAAASLMLLSQLALLPGGGDMLKLDGTRLAIGLVGNFALGALMTVGVGLYAPCLILVSMLGMNPTAAFPIMMGSCAFLMPVASTQFIKADRYDPKVALGLLVGGLPAVLIAAFIVKSLPLGVVRWLVIVVVVFTAITMLRAARRITPGHSGVFLLLAFVGAFAISERVSAQSFATRRVVSSPWTLALVGAPVTAVGPRDRACSSPVECRCRRATAELS